MSFLQLTYASGQFGCQIIQVWKVSTSWSQSEFLGCITDHHCKTCILLFYTIPMKLLVLLVGVIFHPEGKGSFYRYQSMKIRGITFQTIIFFEVSSLWGFLATSFRLKQFFNLFFFFFRQASGLLRRCNFLTPGLVTCPLQPIPDPGAVMGDLHISPI
jgi:hypothetical protein